MTNLFETVKSLTNISINEPAKIRSEHKANVKQNFDNLEQTV